MDNPCSDESRIKVLYNRGIHCGKILCNLHRCIRLDVLSKVDEYHLKEQDVLLF